MSETTDRFNLDTYNQDDDNWSHTDTVEFVDDYWIEIDWGDGDVEENATVESLQLEFPTAPPGTRRGSVGSMIAVDGSVL